MGRGAGRRRRRDQGLFLQRRGGAGLDAGTTGDALGFEETLALAGSDARTEAAPLDGQRQRALHLIAGPHAARADDAGVGIKSEIGIALVFWQARVACALAGVAALAHAQRLRHLADLGARGRIGRNQRRGMIREVQVHHAAPQLGESLRLRMHLHALAHQRGARSRIPLAALDLHQAQAAGTESLEVVGGTQLRNTRFHERCRPHDRSAFGHRGRDPIDFQRDSARGKARGGTGIDMIKRVHDRFLCSTG